MNLKRVVGLTLIIVSGIQGWTNTITGAVIGASSTSSMIVIAAFIAGLVLVLLAKESRDEEGDLENRASGVIRTEKFQKAIRKYDQKTRKKIDAAIAKIGTGQANEERLKHQPGWTIRVDKGGRIMYHIQDGQYVLDGYEPRWHDKY